MVKKNWIKSNENVGRCKKEGNFGLVKRIKMDDNVCFVMVDEKLKWETFERRGNFCHFSVPGLTFPNL